MWTVRAFLPLLLVLSPVVLGGCASGQSARKDVSSARDGARVLRGEVVYSEPLLLPGDAVTYVALRQRNDDGETTIARARVDSCISSPLPFEMTVRNDAFDPFADHCLLAEIHVDGERYFVGTEENIRTEGLDGGRVKIVASLVP